MAGFRPLPWLLLLDVAAATGRALHDVDPVDRARALEIAKRTKGLPHHVTPEERADLSRIARTIDVRKLAAQFAPRGTRRFVRGAKK